MTPALARLSIAIALLLSACAPSTVQTDYQSVPKLARPNTILVYDFAVSADEVQLDSGLVGKVEAKASGKPRTQQELEVGHTVAGIISLQLVAGAIGGHLAVAAAAGVGMHAVSEKLSGDVDTEARRTAKAIGKQLRGYFQIQGWLPPAQ